MRGQPSDDFLRLGAGFLRALIGERLVEQLHGMKGGDPVMIVHIPSDGHKASRTSRGDGTGTRLAKVLYFLLGNSIGNLWEIKLERPTSSAAGVRLFHFHIFDLRQLLEDLSWGIAHLLSASQVAGVMVGDSNLLSEPILTQRKFVDPYRNILHDVKGLFLQNLRLGGIHPLPLQHGDVPLLESGTAGGTVRVPSSSITRST
jgi:hypothetical protein